MAVGGSSLQAQKQDHFLKRIANDWSNIKACYQNCVQRNQMQQQQQQQQQETQTTQMTTVSTQQQQQPQAPLLFPSAEFPFDFDGFNDSYWFGIGEGEVSGLHSGWQM